MILFKKSFLIYLPLIVLINLYSTLTLAGSKLAVYYPTIISVSEREKALKNELKQQEIVIFGRSNEFQNWILTEDVPVVIAPYSFEFTQNDYKPIFQFEISNKKQFYYTFIALKDSNLDIGKIENSVIGAIEEIDREKIKAYFKNSVGINLKKINLVPRTLDLFSLLVFNAVDAVVVSEEIYPKLLNLLKIDTVEIKVNSKLVPFPRVYARPNAPPELIKEIGALSVQCLNTMGFDKIDGIQNE